MFMGTKSYGVMVLALWAFNGSARIRQGRFPSPQESPKSELLIFDAASSSSPGLHTVGNVMSENSATLKSYTTRIVLW